MSHHDLRGKVALITGVGRGIGRSLSLALHQAGVRITGCALELDELEQLEKELTGSYLAAVDVTNYQAFQRFFQVVCRDFGVPDTVIANAGVTDQAHHSLADLPVEIWRKVIEVNLTGTFITLKTVLPPMAAAGFGNVTVVTSLLGQKGHGQANDGPYCASKFGIEGLVEVAVDEFKQSGLNINTVSPAAMVDTGFFATWPAADRVKLAPPDVLNDLVLYLSTLPPFSLTGQSINGKLWNTDGEYRTRLLSAISKTGKDD